MSEQTFTFGQVSAALADVHEIAPERLRAFQARLKHYQKQSYPPGINTGRGRAAVYLIEHVIKLALALELNQMGISPERAIYVLELNQYRWSSALRVGEIGARDPKVQAVYLYFDPCALDDLRRDNAEDCAEYTFHYAGLGQLHEALDDWSKWKVTRVALVNATATLDKITSSLAEKAGVAAGVIGAAIRQWALGDYLRDGDDQEA